VRHFFSRIAKGTYDPEGLIAGVWTQKSESARVALPGIRRSGEAAFFAA